MNIADPYGNVIGRFENLFEVDSCEAAGEAGEENGDETEGGVAAAAAAAAAFLAGELDEGNPPDEEE